MEVSQKPRDTLLPPFTDENIDIIQVVEFQKEKKIEVVHETTVSTLFIPLINMIKPVLRLDPKYLKKIQLPGENMLKFQFEKNLISGWYLPPDLCQTSPIESTEECWSSHKPKEILGVFLKDKKKTDYRVPKFKTSI